MFITYANGEEVIITTPEHDDLTIREYFTEGGRDLDDYDRTVVTETEVLITSRLYIG